MSNREPADDRVGESGSTRWQLSYDQASVERFLADVAAERERLLSEIDVANKRVVVATTRAAALEQEAQASLGGLVLAAQKELSEIEREHHELVARIRASAEAEASRLLAAAEREASAMREAASSLGAHLGGSADVEHEDRGRTERVDVG